MLQFLGLQHDDLLDLLILVAEHGGECLLTSGKVLLLGVQLGLVLLSSSLVLGGMFPHCLLGFLDVSLLQDELLFALSQLFLGGLQLFVGWWN